MKKYLQDKLAMNLQFFADPEDDPKDPQGADDPKDKTGDDDDNDKIVFDSQEELDKLIAGRVAKERKNLQKQFDDQLDDKITAALEREKDLSKLSKEDRERKEFSDKEKKLADKEKKFALMEQRYQAIDELQERNLPKSFADLLVHEDAEQTLNNIKSFEEAFNAAVEEQVESQVADALKGKGPKRKGATGNMVNPFAKETFNLTEQGKLLKENPELYKTLKAQAN